MNERTLTQPGENTVKVRNTNLELFRIITMLLIIAHHYVVNSGLMDVFIQDLSQGRVLFLMLFGAWGKIGINCFVLITGYFMCQSHMTAKKFFKLLFEVMFYRIVINGIFWLTGYESVSATTLLRLLPVDDIDNSFTETYLVFMLCIPFVNVLVRNLTQKQHFYLLLLMSFIYIFFESLKPILSVMKNHVSWYFVLYLLASYVRLYPNKVFSSAKIWGWLTVASILLCIASVFLGLWIGATFFGTNLGFYFVTDSNTFLATLTGFSAFMFFKNLQVPYSKFINALASTCFGVLQIHANSNTMRRWLWRDVLNNTGVFSEAWMPVHAIVSVILVFLICAGIDYLRILWLEKPVFVLWEKHWPGITARYKRIEKRIFEKFRISQ